MTESVGREGDRRSFVRRGLAGLCACGCAGGFLGGASTERPRTSAPLGQDGDGMPRKWIAKLSQALSEEDPGTARRLMQAASASHWEDLGMETTTQPFRGDIPAFLDFLRSEWGWVIEFDAEAGVIQVNENKAECVCPLVAGSRSPDLGALCYCSEGFAERLFGSVSPGPVQARVVESILRGGERCRYRIQLQV